MGAIIPLWQDREKLTDQLREIPHKVPLLALIMLVRLGTDTQVSQRDTMTNLDGEMTLLP